MTTTQPARAPGHSLPPTMRAVQAQRYGTPDELEVVEVPVPSPAGGEVLVRVHASSLNALDWHFLTGTPYLLRPSNGFRRPRRTIPGADVAGEVVALGPDVTTLAVGDAVFGEAPGGGCAGYARVKSRCLAPMPPEASFEAAGATPVAGLTAWQTLHHRAAVQPGDRVLVNGAAGGVGTFATQIAVALGAEVTAVCSTRNVERVRALGARTVVDYTSEDVVAGGARFDVVVDNVGNRTPREILSMLRPGARVVGVSGPKTNRWLGPVLHLGRLGLACRRAGASFHMFTASPDRDDLVALGALLADGSVVPAVDRVVGLGGVAEAMAEIGTGHARAKIVVIPD